MIGNLKMTITAYKDPYFMQIGPFPPFIVHVNPETYSQRIKVNFPQTQAQATSAGQGSPTSTESQVLKFDLLLDRTGALGNMDTLGLGVEPDILHFKRLTIDYEGSIHKQPYLTLLWGSLIFHCHLQELEIEYKLFNKAGIPVRAVLKATFREFRENVLRTLLEKKSSPDLTHIRTVKEGDTLPQMTHKIYGDASYYLQIAKVNRILNFRRLSPGQEIYFPPIEKMNSL